MPFQRRILHHGPTPAGTPVVLSLDAVQDCWFELHRQGGCGSAELSLSSTFDLRTQIELGDWISFESTTGERWYLGRVEERESRSPAQIRFRLEGMAIELNEIFPGGFGELADGRKPHRYARTDLFDHDPDRGFETYDSVESVTEMISLLMTQYILPSTPIVHDPLRIETPLQSALIESVKFRGEESVRSIIKELATRAQSASWGVDQTGTFFFAQPQFGSVATFQESVDLTLLRERRDREHLFNRLLLTGDYVYDRKDQSDWIARRSYRWRGNFIEPISQAQHGDRRIRIWVPWVRTQQDSLAFAREFFRSYSQPVSRFEIETTSQDTLIQPWNGRITLLDQTGTPLTTAFAETIRVQFDHAPVFRMELGPLDPHMLWPEPPQDERWELPEQEPSAGGPVTLPPPLPDGGGGGGGGGSSDGPPSSDFDLSVGSSLDSTEVESSLISSELSSEFLDSSFLSESEMITSSGVISSELETSNGSSLLSGSTSLLSDESSGLSGLPSDSTEISSELSDMTSAFTSELSSDATTELTGQSSEASNNSMGMPPATSTALPNSSEAMTSGNQTSDFSSEISSNQISSEMLTSGEFFPPLSSSSLHGFDSTDGLTSESDPDSVSFTLSTETSG